MQNQRFVPGRNRKIRETPSGVEYVLYDTPVVTVSRCGRCITLNSGGHRTQTTRMDMNRVSTQYNLGFNVYQNAGDWVVTTAAGVRKFFDGMTLI